MVGPSHDLISSAESPFGFAGPGRLADESPGTRPPLTPGLGAVTTGFAGAAVGAGAVTTGCTAGGATGCVTVGATTGTGLAGAAGTTGSTGASLDSKAYKQTSRLSSVTQFRVLLEIFLDHLDICFAIIKIVLVPIQKPTADLCLGA